MGWQIPFALAAGLLTGACGALSRSDCASALEVSAADALAAKQQVARELCVAAGFTEHTRLFAHCVAAQYAREAARLRAHARSLAAGTARQRGLCLDPVRFELARCIEI